MSDKPETIAAILAEMRASADKEERGSEGWVFCGPTTMRRFADRLEAAVERERDEADERIRNAWTEGYCMDPDKSAPGNVAAIREALLGLAKFTCSCCNERYCEDDIEEEDGVRVPNPCGAIIAARNALSAPARNCDRFKTEGDAHLEYLGIFDHPDPVHYAKWLFAPAEGKESDYA